MKYFLTTGLFTIQKSEVHVCLQYDTAGQCLIAESIVADDLPEDVVKVMSVEV